MTIAVLGGRFDPPHWGHFWVSRQVLEKRPDIDQVWFVPAFKHQWKKCVVSSKDRLHMLSFFAQEKIKVSDIEIRRGGVSYTIDTVREIKKKFGFKLYWLIGADILAEFKLWQKKEELTKETTFLVFPRDPHTMPLPLPSGFEGISSGNLIVTNLSSTAIRYRVRQGQSIHGFVPDEVEKYIMDKGLYR